jgi:alkylhydroperoxidase family enzyme
VCENCNVFYMPRIEALGDDDLTSWLTPRPQLAAGLGALSGAVYQHSALPLRVREIARMRIAEDNECQVCRNTRHGQGESEGVDEEFYRHVTDWRDWPGYTERERIAAEFAERIATDHRALRDDEDFWSRCKAHFDDAEILDLGICCSLWLGSGRLMRVLDVAQACKIVL